MVKTFEIWHTYLGQSPDSFHQFHVCTSSTLAPPVGSSWRCIYACNFWFSKIRFGWISLIKPSSTHLITSMSTVLVLWKTFKNISQDTNDLQTKLHNCIWLCKWTHISADLKSTDIELAMSAFSHALEKMTSRFQGNCWPAGRFGVHANFDLKTKSHRRAHLDFRFSKWFVRNSQLRFVLFIIPSDVLAF